MKKKNLIIIVTSFILILGVILFLVLNSKINYTIKVSLVDDHSPDRVLTVYNDKNEKIDVKKIVYLDGTLLCNGYNTTVHFGDIENEEVFKIILKDNTEAKARIIKEEVK